MVGEALVLCWFCKHLILDYEFQKKHGTFGCTAFPEGIPEEIGGDDRGVYWFDHRAPHPDDHGIQFELEDIEQLKSRPPFEKGTMSQMEGKLYQTYDYVDRLNALRDEHPDE
jgi:hypothetical protein